MGLRRLFQLSHHLHVFQLFVFLIVAVGLCPCRLQVRRQHRC